VRQLSINSFAQAIRTRARLRDNFTEPQPYRDPHIAQVLLHSDKNILDGRLMPPNESRLSGALKKGSFRNVRAPPASSACEAARSADP